MSPEETLDELVSWLKFKKEEGEYLHKLASRSNRPTNETSFISGETSAYKTVLLYLETLS